MAADGDEYTLTRPSLTTHETRTATTHDDFHAMHSVALRTTHTTPQTYIIPHTLYIKIM